MDKTKTALSAFIIAGGLAFVSHNILESGPLRFTVNLLITTATAIVFSKINQKIDRKEANTTKREKAEN